jgi:hypothetical protein
MTAAAGWPARSEPAKSQFFRLWVATQNRKNWLVIGSQQAGERAAKLMRLIKSAKLNGHDAWAYLKDVLTKLPTWPNSRMAELLPHLWAAPSHT